MNLNNSFLKFCEEKEYEINQSQITIIEKLGRCWCGQNHDFKFFL